MGCTNCFNGCTETTSDKCVKYTGNDVPALNITKGDSLMSVEDNIILKILSMIIGEGIIPEVDAQDICAEVMANLPDLSIATLNDYITAIIKAVCANVTSIDDINTILSALNSDYTLDCITSFVDPEDVNNTHAVVQALIDVLCSTIEDLNALTLNLTTNYVAIEDLDGYIAAYLEANAPSDLISNKMIPFVAVEYYGTLANFNAGGAGIGLWDKVYLCNGANGTPDKRGVVPVGVTTVAGGGAYNPAVDPGNPDNPNYVLNTPLGANTVTLTSAQMPSHTHIATSVVSGSTTVPVPFIKEVIGVVSPRVLGYNSVGDEDSAIRISEVATVNTSGTIVTTTNASTGGGDSHSNIQPVLPCYYIMFIP